ncbi:MAG: tetratricopeptide repeat protein [bacterium]|nr:tetratricopeptide repeat protein [bacterium]
MRTDIWVQCTRHGLNSDGGKWRNTSPMQVIKRSLEIFLPVLVLVVPTLVLGGGSSDTKMSSAEVASEAEVPAGLQDFLDATIAASRGDMDRAEALYKRSLETDPTQIEVRVRYAAMLLEFGRSAQAWELLKNHEMSDDWFSLRTRALVLAQVAGDKPELLGEAEVALNAAVDVRSDDPNLQLSLAQVLQRLARFSDAEEVLAELREARPNNPRLLMFHAQLLRAMGSFDRAAELYRQCVDRDIIPYACQDNLIEVLIQMGNHEEAGELLLETADTNRPEDFLRAGSLLLEAGRPDRALVASRRALAVDSSLFLARRLEAVALSAMGRYGEAIPVLERLLRKSRADVGTVLPLAWAYSQTGRLEDARKNLDRAWSLAESGNRSEDQLRVAVTAARVELAKDHNLVAREWMERIPVPEISGPEPVRLLAVTYRRTEEWREGISAMLRLAPQLQGSARTHAVAFEAEFRLHLGQEQQGMEALRSIIRSAEITDVALALDVLQVLERWEDVAEFAGEALSRFPNNRGLRFTQAASYERLGRIREAESIFHQMVTEEPNDAVVANYLGYMWANQDENLDRALELIQHAVSLEPDSAAYIDSLGWVFYRLGKIDEAERWLRRSIVLGGADGTILAHLGEVLLVGGKTEEGRITLQRALDLGCDDPDHVIDLLEGRMDEE